MAYLSKDARLVVYLNLTLVMSTLPGCWVLSLSEVPWSELCTVQSDGSFLPLGHRASKLRGKNE